MSTEPGWTGDDGELGVILTDVFACNRVWSAWSIGTMTEDDFVPAAEDPDLTGDLIAWRDAAAPAITDNQRWQVGEARDILAAWDRDRAVDGGYNTERTLADQLRGMLAIIDQISPAKET